MRKLIVLAAMAAVAAVLVVLNLGQGQPASGSHLSGLVAYWPFDDGADPTADVAHGNDGTLVGGAGYQGGLDIAPVSGNVDALDLGSGTDYVTVADDSELDIAGSLSISAWLSLDADTGLHNIVSKDTAIGAFSNYNLHILGGRVFFSFTFDAAVTFASASPGTGNCDSGGCFVHAESAFVDGSHPLGTWRHVAGVYDDSSKTMTVYLDGVKDGEATFSTAASPLPNNELLQIGKRKFQPGSNGINGQIDEVCIWDRVLSATEIADLENGASCLPSPVTCVSAPSGLVSWWPGDGDALDIADGNPGTLNGDATFATGQVGQAFSFDGAGDFVRAADASNLNIQNAITLDAWVNLNSFVGVQMVAGRPSGYQIVVLANGKVRFAFPPVTTASVTEFADSAAPIPLNTWTHIAATYDSSDDGLIKIYVNGAFSNSKMETVDGIRSMVAPFEIGGFGPAFSLGFLDGLVDEVELYDRALTQPEIEAIFDAGSAGKCKAPTPPPVVCSTEVRNTVNIVGKGRPFKKGTLENARVVMLSKDTTVHTQLEIQNLLNAPDVWTAFDALTVKPETVFSTGSDGTVTVESVTPSGPPPGWAIYADATDATVNNVDNAEILPVANGATQRAVANSECADKKHMQWIATLNADETALNITSARQQHIKGSLLTILYPEETVWDQGTQLYPFIFTSDSDWTVDICAEVPAGYNIVGAYDENGDLMTGSSCAQTFVTGETKVVAFEVVDVGSPEPMLDVLLTVEHEGKVTEVDIEIPGVRSYVEPAPAQLPTSGADPASDGTPVWPAVAALAGVAALLLGSFVVWRRRRA